VAGFFYFIVLPVFALCVFVVVRVTGKLVKLDPILAPVPILFAVVAVIFAYRHSNTWMVCTSVWVLSMCGFFLAGRRRNKTGYIGCALVFVASLPATLMFRESREQDRRQANEYSLIRNIENTGTPLYFGKMPGWELRQVQVTPWEAGGTGPGYTLVYRSSTTERNQFVVEVTPRPATFDPPRTCVARVTSSFSLRPGQCEQQDGGWVTHTPGSTVKLSYFEHDDVLVWIGGTRAGKLALVTRFLTSMQRTNATSLVALVT
jgi:hypothetical protein